DILASPQLPRDARPSVSARTGAAVGSGSSPGAPAVLILMEDRALRYATRLLLETDGYRVLTAAILPEALNLARRERGIDILLVNDSPCAGTTAEQAVTSLRQVIGSGLKALVIAGEVSQPVRALRRDGLARIATMPVAADALLGALSLLRHAPVNALRSSPLFD
ncbi:MAG TPA: hypothetical protein VHE11_16465, partial [Steroidobacteraceae bacterium]|nr:hypothetical protein [Steroidobacteraceae bacterium]